MNNQLFASNDCAFGSLHPRKGLLRQAGHLIAFRTEEMDVIAGALAGRPLTVRAEAPGAIRSLDPVKKTGLLQGLEGTVDRNPVEGSGPPFLFEDVVMREGPPRVGEHLQDGLPRAGSSQPPGLKEFGGRFHGLLSVVKVSIERLYFMQQCCK